MCVCVRLTCGLLAGHGVAGLLSIHGVHRHRILCGWSQSLQLHLVHRVRHLHLQAHTHTHAHTHTPWRYVPLAERGYSVSLSLSPPSYLVRIFHIIYLSAYLLFYHPKSCPNKQTIKLLLHKMTSECGCRWDPSETLNYVPHVQLWQKAESEVGSVLSAGSLNSTAANKLLPPWTKPSFTSCQRQNGCWKINKSGRVEALANVCPSVGSSV